MEKTESGEKPTDADDGTMFLAAGGGLTAIAVVGFAAAGAACPACVVGAPLLVGYGLYKKYKSRTVT